MASDFVLFRLRKVFLLVLTGPTNQIEGWRHENRPKKSDHSTSVIFNKGESIIDCFLEVTNFFMENVVALESNPIFGIAKKWCLYHQRIFWISKTDAMSHFIGCPRANFAHFNFMIWTSCGTILFFCVENYWQHHLELNVRIPSGSNFWRNNYGFP